MVSPSASTAAVKNILRAGNRNLRKSERRAAQSLCARLHVTVINGNLRAEFFERLNVQINRTRPDRASAGKRNVRISKSRHERPQRKHGSAHGLHQFVRRLAHAKPFQLEW